MFRQKETEKGYFERIKNKFRGEDPEIEYPDFEEIEEEAINNDLIQLPQLEEDRYTKLDSYWLYKGFSKALIYYDEFEENSEYRVIDPKIDEYLDLKNGLRKELKNKLLKVDIKENKEKLFYNNFKKVIRRVKEPIEIPKFLKLYYHLKRDLLGYGGLQPFIEDNYLEDISINGVNIPLFVYHQRHQDLETNVKFGKEELESLVMNVAERSDKRINFARPMAEATMPDGSRAQMSLGDEVTIRGSTITIRKFSEVPITPTDLISWETLSPEMMAYLWFLAENERNIMIVGGTATGKTTTLNAMTLFIPWGAKVVTIEDTHELRLPFDNWVPSVTRPQQGVEAEDIDMYDLLRGALRQRPEYIIVGEIRGKEAVTLFQAMSTGHTSFSTLHAPTVERTINRLENPPIEVPKSMIPTLDAIVVQSFVRGKEGKKRKVKEIQEIGNYNTETNSIQTNLLFRWNSNKNSFEKLSNSINLKLISDETGTSYSKVKSEIQNRSKILSKMIENDVRRYKDVVKSIKRFQKRKQELYNELGIKDES
ncbi:secretion system protein E [archaeon SCG-AAA382B04]|nr:secretion system protein E [archaeon SCG-AAA382B04]